MRSVAGVILAGGQSSRMGGGDKCLLPLGDRVMLDHVLARFQPQVSALALNANGDAARFARFGLPVISDSFSGFQGPLAGVLAGLDWAASAGFDHIVTVSADTPFFPCDLVAQLQLQAETSGAPIVLAATNGEPRRKHRHPTFGLWPVDLRDDLREALHRGIRKVVAWSDTHGASEAVFPATGGIEPFFNINTPDDMGAAQKMIKGQKQ